MVRKYLCSFDTWKIWIELGYATNATLHFYKTLMQLSKLNIRLWHTVHGIM